MNTKLLMIFSALFMGILGFGLSFLPQEIASYFDLQIVGVLPVLLQVMGGLYVAFAFMNWTAKANLIGGIYSRPVAVANVIHFMSGTFYWIQTDIWGSVPLLIITLGYLAFAISFGIVLFRHPVKP